MTEQQIETFWQQYPCGEWMVGRLSGRNAAELNNFFSTYDQIRYDVEGHILKCLDSIDFTNKKVLEIGLGQGADSEQIIRRGALWSGIDLTAEAVRRTKLRFELRGLPYERISQASVLAIPFPDASFDIVFSHGVLHHVPDIAQAQREIRRVLGGKGELVIMVYAKWSLNYLLSIALLRRLALLVSYVTKCRSSGKLGQHLSNARASGIWTYLAMTNFIHRNTDGPLNPYSKVYSISTVAKDFAEFAVVKGYKRFMHAPPFRVRWLPLAPLLGWHLWVHLRPRD